MKGADDVEGAAAPVIGHLAAAAGRVGGSAGSLQEHVLRSDAEGEAQGAIAIVGEEPVVAGTEGEACADLQRFVAGAGDLEEKFLLALEEDFAVVDAPGEKHQAVDFDEPLRGQSDCRGFRVLRASRGNRKSHSRYSQRSCFESRPCLIVSTCGKSWPIVVDNPAFRAGWNYGIDAGNG